MGKFLNFSLFNFWPHAAACRILVPQPGIKPTPPALAGRLLTTGPLGRPLVGKSHKEKKQRLKICTGKKNKKKTIPNENNFSKMETVKLWFLKN